MRKGLMFMLIAVALSSCLKRVDYPNRPHIEFLGFYPNLAAVGPSDSLGAVKFSFTDGDGDLGLNEGDTIGEFAQGQPYNYNLFINYFEKQNGVFVEVVPPFPFHVRFKRLTSEGGNGELEGEMEVGVTARPGTPYDTIRYEMYIVDRALQHSDTIVTSDIILP
ncbi:MAG: hypothetical protein K9G41_08935 [Flavobacteriales bacterium]|nr:hypothetical protein [Flavobacteriales bacterium]